MILKKIISIFLVIVMLLSFTSIAFATDDITITQSGFIGKNIMWEYNEIEQALTISGEGPLENAYIGFVDTSAGYLTPEYKTVAKFAKKLVIGDGITKIGDDAFSGLFYVKELIFGNNIEEIGQNSFKGLASLDNLVIPGNVKNIDSGAFENCINLRSLTLENGVESVGERAFAGAYTLKDVYIPETVSEIGENAFTLFVPGAKYINESVEATIVPDSDISNSFSFTSYDYAEQYAYYIWLDGDMKNCEVYDEKEILVNIYEKFGISYMNIDVLKDDFYNNINIDSIFADDAVIKCFANSAQHNVCREADINHEVSDSDFDCLCGNHNIYENSYLAPTCTDSGYAGGIICLECEEVMESPDIISATGHTDADGDHICDVCGNDIELTFIERVNEFFKGIVNSILAIFRKLFGR